MRARWIMVTAAAVTAAALLARYCAAAYKPRIQEPDPPPVPDQDRIVLRSYPGAPDGWLPPDLDGHWFHRGELSTLEAAARLATAGTVARPTGRFETRDDGKVAEVWEVWPDEH